MRVLVTGGAGYIGSHAVRRLQEHGHEVWVLDNLCFGHAAAVGTAPLLRMDLLETERVAAALRDHRIEAVMHFAAFAFVGESVRDPQKYYQNNVAGSLSLLTAMKQTGVARLVFSSTCATYGIPAAVPITEATPQEPINPYGRTKLMVEWLLADFAAAYGLGYAALRYFNAAGAASSGDLGEDHQPETHLIPLALQVALEQRPHLEVFGDDYPTPDGTCIRDYIHVEDLAQAHVRALACLVPGQSLKLNLGTGRGFSVQEVLTACRKVTGHPIPARIAPRRAGDPPVLVAATAQAEQLLGFKARYQGVEEIVATAWRWHRNHPHGYGDR